MNFFAGMVMPPLSLISLFQCLTTLSIKKFFLKSYLPIQTFFPSAFFFFWERAAHSCSQAYGVEAYPVHKNGEVLQAGILWTCYNDRKNSAFLPFIPPLPQKPASLPSSPSLVSHALPGLWQLPPPCSLLPSHTSACVATWQGSKLILQGAAFAICDLKEKNNKKIKVLMFFLSF